MAGTVVVLAAITGGGFTLTGDTSSDRVKGSTP